MAINFDELPKTNESAFTILENGTYRCKIKEAKIPNGKDYLQVIFAVTGNNGQSTTIFDNFVDSDKPLPRYKLAQLIRALKIPLTGSFELKDLPKIIVGKELMAAIKQEQNEGYSARNVINAFDDEIFYPLATQATGSNPPPANGDVPFDTTPTGGATY